MDEQRTDDPDHPGRPGAAADRPPPGTSMPGRSEPEATGPEATAGGDSRAWWANAPMPPGRPGTLRPAQWEPQPEPEPDHPGPAATRPETWQAVPARPTLVDPLQVDPLQGDPLQGGAGPEPGTFARPRLVAAEQGPDPREQWDVPANRTEVFGNEPTEAFGAAPGDGHRRPDPGGWKPGGFEPGAGPPPGAVDPRPGHRPTQRFDLQGGPPPAEAFEPQAGQHQTEVFDRGGGQQPTAAYNRYDVGAAYPPPAYPPPTYPPDTYPPPGYQPTQALEPQGHPPDERHVGYPPAGEIVPFGYSGAGGSVPGWGGPPDTVQQGGGLDRIAPSLYGGPQRVSPGQSRWVLVGFAVMLPILAVLAVIGLVRGLSSAGDGLTQATVPTPTGSAAAPAATSSTPAETQPEQTTPSPSAGVSDVQPVEAAQVAGLLGGQQVEGQIDSAWRWSDGNGANVLVLSHSQTSRGGRPRSVTFLVTLVARADEPRPVALRRMRDPVDVRCPGSGGATSGFTPDSVAVQDLDGDAVAEVSVGWTARCGGEDQPTRVRLAMLSGSKKYILRGSVVLGQGDPTASLKPDPAVSAWPPQDHAAVLDLARRLYG